GSAHDKPNHLELFVSVVPCPNQTESIGHVNKTVPDTFCEVWRKKAELYLNGKVTAFAISTV
ncbi:MAG: hypothetical protein KDB01_28195, partial [Planctomycetaceae bacterium]|nr:hypothetical protein [Planctomycetaceae bacterium]